MSAEKSCASRGLHDVEAWRRKVRDDEEALSDNRRGSVCRLPAYSSTAEASGSLSPGDNVDLCCAFKHFDWRIPDLSEYDGLKQQSQQLRFLCWVAYCRTPDKTILDQERSRCPMNWCRRQFEMNESFELVNHVSSCSRLSAGEYWCPYCQKHERYATTASLPARSPSKHTRKHFLKDAFQAIRRLGSKSIHKAIHPSRSHTSRSSHQLNQGRSDDTPLLHELPTNDGLDTMELDSKEKRLWDGASLPVKAVRNSFIELSDGQELPFEMEGESPALAELDSDARSCDSCPSMEWEDSHVLTPDSTSSPVSAISLSQPWCRYTAKDFDSPISPTAFTDPTSCLPDPDEQGTYALKALNVELLSFSHRASTCRTPVHIGLVDSNRNLATGKGRALPNIRVDTNISNVDMVWSSPVSDIVVRTVHELPSQCLVSTDVPKTVTSPLGSEEPFVREQVMLVEDLRGIVNVLFKESVRKLCQAPVTSAAAWLVGGNPSAAFVFESGLAGLQKVVKGTLPALFWEIFGISHLAYAAAISSHEQDLPEQFQEIYANILIWSDAIVSEDDKVMFIQLAQELWSPDSHSQEYSLAHKRLSSGSEQSGFRNSLSNPCYYADAATRTPSEYSSYFHGPLRAGEWSTDLRREFMDKSQLLTSLKTGAVVGLCLQWLCSLEFAGLQLARLEEDQNYDRHTDKPARIARPRRIMKENITEPLIQTLGLEGFISAVTNAEKLLFRENPITLRGLELKLIHEGRCCAKSRTLYHSFIEAVSDHCNRTSMVIGWEFSDREQYYLNDIDRLLLIHYDLRAKAVAANNIKSRAFAFEDPVASGRAPQVGKASSTVASDALRPFSFASDATHDFNIGNLMAGQSSQMPDPDISMDQFYDIVELGDGTLYDEINLATPMESSTQDIPLNEPSPSTGAGYATLKCLQCPKVLKGKAIYLPSNMQRHIREKHSSQTRRLSCTVVGCSRSFGRNHNRRHHLQTVHART